MISSITNVLRNKDGKREICIDILVHFAGALSKTITSNPKKTIYSISGDTVLGNSVERKITICYKEETERSVITIEERDGISESIIIEESDTESIVIEESDTESIIIEESDTESKVIITIPKKVVNNNGVVPHDALNTTSQ